LEEQSVNIVTQPILLSYNAAQKTYFWVGESQE